MFAMDLHQLFENCIFLRRPNVLDLVPRRGTSLCFLPLVRRRHQRLCGRGEELRGRRRGEGRGRCGPEDGRGGRHLVREGGDRRGWKEGAGSTPQVVGEQLVETTGGGGRADAGEGGKTRLHDKR